MAKLKGIRNHVFFSCDVSEEDCRNQWLQVNGLKHGVSWWLVLRNRISLESLLKLGQIHGVAIRQDQKEVDKTRVKDKNQSQEFWIRDQNNRLRQKTKIKDQDKIPIQDIRPRSIFTNFPPFPSHFSRCEKCVSPSHVAEQSARALATAASSRLSVKRSWNSIMLKLTG